VLDSDKPEMELLRDSRELFEDAYDYFDAHGWFDNQIRDTAHYHGNQWTDDDRSYLESQGRPVLTFNLLHVKVQHLIGAIEDNMQVPMVAPVGVEDRSLADILNAIKATIYEESGVERTDAQVFEDGSVCGIGNSYIDAVPDPEDPSRVKIYYSRLDPLDVLWDPCARERDRGDARYVFITRWLTIPEFKADYPEHAKYAEELLKQGYVDHPTDGGNADPINPDLYRPSRLNMYYDKARKMIRVVRCEYKVPKKRHVLVSQDTGKSREVEPDVAAAVRSVTDGQLDEQVVWRDEIRWLEFCGGRVLYNDTIPVPIGGFTVTAFICHQDEYGNPYGKVRQLISPQQEVNKRFSQTLHLLTTQAAPGLYAETNAIVDENQAKTSQREAGGITWLQPGGISKIQVREVPKLPESMALHEAALRIIDGISGIWVDQLTAPRGIPEAAATAQLKHRQSLMAMRPVIRGFEQFQQTVLKKFLKLIVEGLGDAQLADALGNPERYKVVDGAVVDSHAPQGSQPVKLDSLRDLKCNIELRPAETYNSSKALAVATLSGLLQSQIPVDPGVLFDELPLSPEQRDALKAYAANQAQSGAKQAEQQASEMQAQLDRQFKLELAGKLLDATKLDEVKRHNIVGELLEYFKVGATRELSDKQLKADDLEQTRSAGLELTKTMMQAKMRSNGRAPAGVPPVPGNRNAGKNGTGVQ